jgi:hypothetical protein
MNVCVATLAVALFSYGGETVSAPTPAITAEHAARLYRIEVYNQFRHDRAEYNRRFAQSARVWKSFDEAGQPAQQRDAVVAWFVAAREAAHRNALPPALNLVSDNVPPVVIAPLLEEHPVTTSAREQPVLPDNAPADAVTTLEVQLPPSAVQTQTKRVAAPFIKQTTVRTLDPEIEGTTAPVIIELPADRRAIDTSAPIVAPTATKSKPKADAKPKAPTRPEPIAVEDPYAVKALFEPAVSPAETTEAATDADPFAP